MTGTKPLPRAENGDLLNTFMASGHRYYILSEGDAFPISRWMLWGQFSQQYLSGQDFQSMYNQLHKLEDLLDGYTRSTVKFPDIVLHVRAGKDALKVLSQTRFDTGLYLATLFILREGENINEWTTAFADEKISDWAQEGYSTLDFFDLSATMLISYLNALKKLADAMTGAVENTSDLSAPFASQTKDTSGSPTT